MSIILASKSRIRQRILCEANIPFSVVPSNIDETIIKEQHKPDSFDKLAVTLASKKALSVSDQHPNEWVIGADQLCVLHNQFFDKPGNQDNAIKQLAILSGKTHQLISALCIVKNNELLWTHVETTHMHMRSLNQEEIIDYVERDQPFHSCGAYYYESLGKSLFHKIEGDLSSICGCPIQPLKSALSSLMNQTF